MLPPLLPSWMALWSSWSYNTLGGQNLMAGKHLLLVQAVQDRVAFQVDGFVAQVETDNNCIAEWLIVELLIC